MKNFFLKKRATGYRWIDQGGDDDHHHGELVKKLKSFFGHAPRWCWTCDSTLSLRFFFSFHLSRCSLPSLSLSLLLTVSFFAPFKNVCQLFCYQSRQVASFYSSLILQLFLMVWLKNQRAENHWWANFEQNTDIFGFLISPICTLKLGLVKFEKLIESV